GVHGGLHRARGVAGQICAAAGLCRGHVQPLALRPLRDRHSRGASGEMSENHHSSSSCPGKSAKRFFARMTRASTTVVAGKKDVDGRAKPGHDGGGSGRRRFFRVAVALAFVLIVITTAFSAWVVSLGPLPLEEARKVSITIVDRNGKLLRAFAMADGRWRLPVDAKTAVDPGYLKLLLAYEDRRFWSHGGVD